MTLVLVTGATGFVGQTLCERLALSGHIVRAALRSDRPVPLCVSEKVVVGDIGASTDWSRALRGVDAVLHVAARAHILNDPQANSDAYFETNARGTRGLAAQAARAGVRRLVFLSSIKVNGEGTVARAYTSDDEPNPQDPYGSSKWLGEQYLCEVAAGSNLETAIVRSPLVYGPGVRANFLRLLGWVAKERPLPLGAVHNRRSLVSSANLADLLVRLVIHPRASGRVWMAADGEDLSTPGLILRIGSCMHRRVRLLPVPTPILRLAGLLTGKSAEVARLCGDLRVDITRTRNELGWIPPDTVDAGIARTVEWYLAESRSRGAGGDSIHVE